MRRIFARMCLCVLAAGVLTAFAPRTVCAGEAEDEEAAAKREKDARDKIEAEKKARRSPAAKDTGKKESPFGTDNADPDAIDISKFAPKPEAPPAQGKNPLAPKTANSPLVPVVPDTAPVPNCPVCKGMGIIPNLPYKAYTKFEGQPAPNPDFAPPWKYCDKCQKAMDPKQISDDMKERQQRAVDKHKQYEELAGKPLKLFETPFIAVHSQLPPGTNKTVANALEKCAGILQNNSKSMVLMTVRPDEDDIVMIGDQPTYDTYIDKFMANSEASARELAKKGSGIAGNHFQVFRMVAQGATAESRAVFGFGAIIMRSATDFKSKPWLNEGFAAYCENATLGSNSNYSFTYEMNQVKFGKNWNDDMKKCAKDGKLKPWVEIFNIDLSHMKPFEYLTCYSVVSCLIKIDPVRFDKVVQFVKNGEDSGPAIEKAYGRKIPELQTLWLQWIQTQK